MKSESFLTLNKLSKYIKAQKCNKDIVKIVYVTSVV